MRALGLDLGSKRIGVAISDSAGAVATPIEVVHRSGSRSRDHRAILALVGEWDAEIVVVGLPLSMDGSIGPAAQGVLEEVAEIERAVPVPVTTYDERLTTVTADRSLMEMGHRSRERRRVVDMVAATVLLQGWLDRERGRHE